MGNNKKPYTRFTVEHDEASGDSWTAFFDGAAEPFNPGFGGAGWVLYDNIGTQVDSGAMYCGQATNNQAEYIALLNLVDACVRLGVTDIVIYGDSQLVVQQINGKWQCKKPHLEYFCRSVHDRLANIPRWSVKWVGRDHSVVADDLSKRALQVAGLSV